MLIPITAITRVICWRCSINAVCGTWITVVLTRHITLSTIFGCNCPIICKTTIIKHCYIKHSMHLPCVNGSKFVNWHVAIVYVNYYGRLQDVNVMVKVIGIKVHICNLLLYNCIKNRNYSYFILYLQTTY